MAQRHESDYIILRNFHNFIKSQLISNSAKKLARFGNVSLVDISVGRGGDLFKWYNSNIDYVLGFDPDEDSIIEANSRLANFKRKPGVKTKVDFRVATITDQKFTLEFPHQKTFNIVSCQFSIHYFFKSIEMAESAMMRIAHMLKPGGFFIGTTLDGDKINKLLLEKPKVENKHYTIEKKYKNYENGLYEPFGSQYDFRLLDKDQSGNYFTKISEEFLVSKQILEQVCKNFGLKLVQYRAFGDWYKTYSRKGMTDYEKSVSFLYFSFIFQKPFVRMKKPTPKKTFTSKPLTPTAAPFIPKPKPT